MIDASEVTYDVSAIDSSRETVNYEENNLVARSFTHSLILPPLRTQKTRPRHLTSNLTPHISPPNIKSGLHISKTPVDDITAMALQAPWRPVPPPSTDRFIHRGILFPCFLCHGDVRQEFESFGLEFSGVRYCKYLHKKLAIFLSVLCSLAARTVRTFLQRGSIRPEFVGRDSIFYIKRAISSNHPEIVALDVCAKKHILYTHCSADTGYGVLCHMEAGDSHRNFICMAHQCCLKLAASLVGEDEDGFTTGKSKLIGLAYRMRAMPARTEVKMRNRNMLFRLLLDITNSAAVTPYTALLKKTSTLPQELVDMITVHLEGSVVIALLRTHQTLIETLLKTGQMCPHTQIWPDIDVFGPIGDASYLSARLTSLQGENYLIELSRGGEPRADAKSIHISDHKEMEGVQVAISSFGLRALRIIYSDASTSSWLGDPADCWLGMVLGTRRGTWQVVSDVCV